MLTDFDHALKKALGQVFGDTQQQLCFWHIKKNIEAQVKKKWLGKLEGCKIMGQAKQDTARDAAEFDPNPSSQIPLKLLQWVLEFSRKTWSGDLNLAVQCLNKLRGY